MSVAKREIACCSKVDSINERHDNSDKRYNRISITVAVEHNVHVYTCTTNKGIISHVITTTCTYMYMRVLNLQLITLIFWGLPTAKNSLNQMLN